LLCWSFGLLYASFSFFFFCTVGFIYDVLSFGRMVSSIPTLRISFPVSLFFPFSPSPFPSGKFLKDRTFLRLLTVHCRYFTVFSLHFPPLPTPGLSPFPFETPARCVESSNDGLRGTFSLFVPFPLLDFYGYSSRTRT